MVDRPAQNLENDVVEVEQEWRWMQCCRDPGCPVYSASPCDGCWDPYVRIEDSTAPFRFFASKVRSPEIFPNWYRKWPWRIPNRPSIPRCNELEENCEWTLADPNQQLQDGNPMKIFWEIAVSSGLTKRERKPDQRARGGILVADESGLKVFS